MCCGKNPWHWKALNWYVNGKYGSSGVFNMVTHLFFVYQLNWRLLNAWVIQILRNGRVSSIEFQFYGWCKHVQTLLASVGNPWVHFTQLQHYCSTDPSTVNRKVQWEVCTQYWIKLIISVHLSVSGVWLPKALYASDLWVVHRGTKTSSHLLHWHCSDSLHVTTSRRCPLAWSICTYLGKKKRPHSMAKSLEWTFSKSLKFYHAYVFLWIFSNLKQMRLCDS